MHVRYYFIMMSAPNHAINRPVSKLYCSGVHSRCRTEMRLHNYLLHAESVCLPAIDGDKQASYLCRFLPFTLKHQVIM